MLTALAEDRARIAELDVQIQDLERSLAALRFEKSGAQERLDSYKYPVLTLPNEIASEIFFHFVPTYPSCPPLRGPLSPMVLTHICRRWRDIALATHALWRAVSLSEHAFYFRGDAKQIWLARSGSLPLSIHMDEYADGHVPGGRDLLAAVLLHRARFEYLKLRLIASSPHTIEGETPLLRHLDLELDYNLPKPLVICDAPLLRSAVLDVVATSNVVLPWQQLTQLTLRVIAVDDCVPILQKTINLVHCKLDLFDRDASDPLPEITLPNLESLCCNGWRDGSSMTDTLDLFIVPALRSLTITEQFLQPSPVDSLTSFMTKSGCTLQEVYISGGRGVRMSSYCTAFPSIQFHFDAPLIDSEEENEQKTDGDPDATGTESNSNSE